MEYAIADIRISLPEELIPRRFAEALRPFAVAEPDGRVRAARPEVAPTAPAADPELILEADTRIHRSPGWQELHRFDFPDAGAECRFGRDGADFLLETLPRNGTSSARFRMSGSGNRAWCDFSAHHHPALFRFGIWVLFNLAALRRNAAAIHASAIRYRDAGLLFLGESGTGKSTHSRLWCRHIPGATLLNDDSPIIGRADGRIRVWGSPWSGKTPCYRNESHPVAAIVRLVQAPENRIRALPPIEALGALLPSAPPAFIRDTELRESICETLTQVIGQVPVYRLECRPDAEAARLVCRTVFGDRPPEKCPRPDLSPAFHTPRP